MSLVEVIIIILYMYYQFSNAPYSHNIRVAEKLNKIEARSPNFVCVMTSRHLMWRWLGQRVKGQGCRSRKWVGDTCDCLSGCYWCCCWCCAVTVLHQKIHMWISIAKRKDIWTEKCLERQNSESWWSFIYVFVNIRQLGHVQQEIFSGFQLWCQSDHLYRLGLWMWLKMAKVYFCHKIPQNLLPFLFQLILFESSV